MVLTFCRLKGKDIYPHKDALIRLRLITFKEYPYLYEGREEEEAIYIDQYINNESGAIILALDGKEVAGAATCILLEDTLEIIKTPLIETGYKPREVLYIGEAMTFPTYRHQGTMYEYYRLWEQYALETSAIRYIAFMVIERPHNHPLKPEGYKTFEEFYQKRGYIKAEKATCYAPWQELSLKEEVLHPLSFWIKQIRE